MPLQINDIIVTKYIPPGPVAVQTCCGQHPCQQEAHPAASISETVDPGLFIEHEVLHHSIFYL